MANSKEIWNNKSSGIGLIIDDEINLKTSTISRIVKALEKNNIPLIKHDKLPNSKLLANLEAISFIILDWKLLKKSSKLAQQGVSLPSSVTNSVINENIEFLKELKNILFCPVFILSNEEIDTINSELKKANLLMDNKANFIFVESKSVFIDFRTLKSKIVNWINNSPPIYVLNMFENSYVKAKNKTFSKFYDLSKDWPIVLYNTAIKDETNYSKEIMNTILRNIENRFIPTQLFAKNLTKRNKISTEEIKKVIEGQAFISKDSLLPNDIDVGDIFKKDQKYYINIRPTCNLRPPKSGSVDDVQLYFLSGSIFKKPVGRKKINKELLDHGKYGHARHEFYCIHEGKNIRFAFKDLEVQKYGDYKEFRIGRIIPPYITDLRNRYSNYLARQGLPRVPEIIK